MDWTNMEDVENGSEHAEMNQYLKFSLEDQSYGISIKDIVEIVSICPISKVPQFPAYAKGIINLRGKVIPVIDVRLRFGMPEKDYDDRTCIIITAIGELTLGFIVDDVQEVADIDQDAIEPAPRLTGSYAHRFLSGVAKVGVRLILLIDSQRLLNEEDLATLDIGSL